MFVHNHVQGSTFSIHVTSVFFQSHRNFAVCPKMVKEETKVEFKSIPWGLRAFSRWNKWLKCTSELQNDSWRAAPTPPVSQVLNMLCEKVAVLQEKGISTTTRPYPGENAQKGEKRWSCIWIHSARCSICNYAYRQNLTKGTIFQKANSQSHDITEI